MKKKILTIALTALLFLSAVALGVSTVFRVEEVTLIASLTPQASVTAPDLQAELKKAYERESTFSLNSAKAKEIVKKYPHLRVTGFERKYPNALEITVAEDTETYAVQTENGYYILSDAGIVVELRDDASNRFDGAPNVLIQGLRVTGSVGGELSGDSAWASMRGLCSAVDKALGGIRKNVISVEVLARAPQTYYLISMREGVRIYIDDPASLTAEKGAAAMEKYLSLTDGERMTGRITVHTIEGKAVADYKAIDEF